VANQPILAIGVLDSVADPRQIVVAFTWGRISMDKEVNVLALVKGQQRYLFLFDDQNRTETLRTLGRFAADPELDFTWYDAAVLSRKIREATAQPMVDDLDDRLSSALRGRS
jgi:DTW domain-containing protein YfiP